MMPDDVERLLTASPEDLPPALRLRYYWHALQNARCHMAFLARLVPSRPALYAQYAAALAQAERDWSQAEQRLREEGTGSQSVNR